VEVQYSQAVGAQYILKTLEERKKIHRRYMRLLRETLLAMTGAISDTLDKIGRDHEEQGGLQWETIMAPWEARLVFMVETNPGNLDAAARQQIQAAIETLADLRKEAQQKCMDLAGTTGHLDSVVRILGDDYIDFPTAAASRGLFPGVPIARTMMTLSKSVEAAAVQQIICLTNKAIDDVVRQWVMLLEAHVGLSDRMRRVKQEVSVTRDMANLNAIKTLLFQVKRDELEPAAQSGQLSKQQKLDGIRAQIRITVRNNVHLITFLRDICRGEQDDEEFETIMRIPYQEPPRQQNV
jgi:hypothetical protein